MKPLSKFFLAALPVIMLLTNACAFSYEMDGQPYMTKEFTISTPGELEVQTSGGSIDVASHNSNKVKVEMYVRKGGTSFIFGDKNVEEALEEYEINISKEGNKVIASA